MIIQELGPGGLERLISIPEVPGSTSDQFLGNKKEKKKSWVWRGSSLESKHLGSGGKRLRSSRPDMAN